jgi:uroporphyrinogen-III decarboxylase
MDLRQARGSVGDNAVLMGNVSTRLLLEGRPEQVAAAATVCLSRGGPMLVLSSSCDVPANAPKENVKALVEAGRKWETA